jgi:hypothetical protein
MILKKQNQGKPLILRYTPGASVRAAVSKKVKFNCSAGPGDGPPWGNCGGSSPWRSGTKLPHPKIEGTYVAKRCGGLFSSGVKKGQPLQGDCRRGSWARRFADAGAAYPNHSTIPPCQRTTFFGES